MTRARDVANLIGSGNYSSTTFTATAGQTVFSIAHTQNFVQVFMNGLLLDLTADYTSNGSAVTLTSGAAAGDEIEVVAYNTFSVGDALNQAAADTRYVNTAGDTITGDTVVATTTQVPLRIENTAANSLGAYLKIRDGNSTSSQHTWIGRSTNDTYIYSNNSDLGMKITNAGQVTIPNQPSFMVRANTGNHSISAGHNSATGFNNSSILHNVGNHYNNSNATFTAPVDGRYHVALNIYTQTTGGTAGGYIGATLNFSNLGYVYSFAENGGDVNLAFSGIFNMSANDTVSTLTYGHAGRTQHYIGQHSYFSGHLLG